MALYIPQMRQRDPSVYYQNTAKSFLDAVRMQRADQRADRALDLQQQQIEQRALHAERNYELAQAQLGMQQEDHDWKKGRREARRAIAKGYADYRRKYADEYEAELNKELESLTESSLFGSKIDRHDDRIYIGYGDKFIQNTTPEEIAKQRLRQRGVEVEPTVDPSLYENIESLEDLNLLGLLGGPRLKYEEFNK